jgi:hypothetical protein
VFARLWRFDHGAFHALTVNMKIGTATSHLRFEVFGSSLKLFVDGTLTLFTNDSVLTATGGVGMRAQRASLGHFQISALQPTTVNPKPTFQDDFSQTTDGNQLSLAWMQQRGDFSIASGVLSGNAPTSIATLNGLSVSSVSLEAHVTVNTATGSAGFVADYGSGAHASYYLALLTEISSTQATLSIAKSVHGGPPKVLTGPTNPITFSAGTAQDLVFTVLGNGASNTLTLQDNTVNKSVSATDSRGALTAGTAGLYGTQGQTFRTFQASVSG